MKRLLILGGGTGGTIVANRMVRHLSRQWQVTVFDPEVDHLYQPSLLFLPFGLASNDELRRPRLRTLHRGVDWRRQAIERIEPSRHRVIVAGGEEVAYDLLVIATGSRIRPDLTDGLALAGSGESVFDFYTPNGSRALQPALKKFKSGRLVVNVVEMPIKCPVAPLEFLFLADDYFKTRGDRAAIDLVLATPLDAAFTRPIAAKRLGAMLEEKGITVETEFSTAAVHGSDKILESYDGRKISYDLLVSVPTHSGAECIAQSGLGNELAFIPTDPHTLAARGLDDVFVIGDATDVPTSKAGSVAHFQAEILAENLHALIAGRTPTATFDGHTNCFVETGGGKAILLDFNYATEPLPGRYPLAGIGPFSLLSESRINHWGKLGFRHLYWQALLPGRPLPVPANMSMSGKFAQQHAPVSAEEMR